jgi:hypothetical protein
MDAKEIESWDLKSWEKILKDMIPPKIVRVEIYQYVIYIGIKTGG